MFSKIVFLGLLAAVICAAIDEPVPIVQQDSDISPDGSFQWSYQSGDGSSQQQSGQLEGTGEDVGENVQGAASWTDPEGNLHRLSYVADKDGYQPQGDDLPQSPAIPEEILKSLEWNKAHPEENVE